MLHPALGVPEAAVWLCRGLFGLRGFHFGWRQPAPCAHGHPGVTQAAALASRRHWTTLSPQETVTFRAEAETTQDGLRAP